MLGSLGTQAKFYAQVRNSYDKLGTHEEQSVLPLLYDHAIYDHAIDSRYATFQNGGLPNEMGRLLADEIVQVMPEISDRASTLVTPLGPRLGWEFADPDVPMVRLWSRFTYSGADGFGPVERRVGGVPRRRGAGLHAG